MLLLLMREELDGAWTSRSPGTSPTSSGGSLSLPGRGRCDRNSLNGILRNRLGHQPRGLHVLDERAQVRRGRLAGLRCADGLLDGSELTVEDPRPRNLLDVGQ